GGSWALGALGATVLNHVLPAVVVYGNTPTRASPAPSLAGAAWLLGPGAGQESQGRLRDGESDRERPHESHGGDAGEAGQGSRDGRAGLLSAVATQQNQAKRVALGDEHKPRKSAQ